MGFRDVRINPKENESTHRPEPYGNKHFGEPAPSVWLVRYSHTCLNKAVSFAYAQPCTGQGLAAVVS